MSYSHSQTLALLGGLIDMPVIKWFGRNWRKLLIGWAVLSFVCFIYLHLSGIPRFLIPFFFAFGQLLGTGYGAFFSLGATLIFTLGVSVIAPLLLVIIPLTLLLLPFLFVSGIFWFLLSTVGSMLLFAFSPVIVLLSSFALFVKAAAWWIANADQREQEFAAVFAALGLSGAPSRRLGGQAKIMTEDEFQDLQNRPMKGAGMRLGTVNGEPCAFATEKHVLVVASTRGGKGRDLIIPNLLDYQGSVFVLDPKGENAQVTYQTRQAFGAVKVLDPFGVSGLPSARFNPLALLAGDMAVTNAHMLADALVEGKDGDHWTSSARGLLTGLLLHVATSPDMASRDLPTVRTLLMGDLDATLQAMTDNTAAPQEVRDVGAWGLKAAENEWASIVSTAVEQTKWLSAPQMADSLRSGGDQVDFSAYRDSVQSVFVCLPAPYFRTFSKWLRLVVASAIDALTKELNPAMPYPTRFVLDELAQLGNLEKVESALTLSAGYGVQLWGIWQHLGDIQRCYPRSGVAGWVSSSGIRLVFATQDNESVKYFAAMCGGALTETDIRHMAQGHMLCLLDGQNPVLVERVPFQRPEPRPLAAPEPEPPKVAPVDYGLGFRHFSPD